MASQEASFLGRNPHWRALLAIVLSFIVLLPMVGTAEAANYRKFAGIVVDAKSGKVLYESAADATRYPASVTKVMTLYILFQELKAGNLTLNTKMTVSKHAASAVPTKLGLRAGATIRVEDAIKALVTLSANDIARVIAEHISGSESKFAQRMTRTAQALGMNRTTYRNASGLPDSKQTTTVRDQAILGIAIYQHFPKYYEYFQTKSFSYGKRTYGNHNRLLGSNGVDGIKTGYINSSGYNLLTAARRDGRHIVVVGFGFNTAGARDSKVRDLVKTYLGKGRSGDYLRTAMIPVPGTGGGNVQVAVAQPVFVQPMPFPAFRMAALTGAPPPTQAATAIIQPTEPAAAPVAAPEPVVVATAQIPVPAEPMDIGIQPALAAANALGAQTAVAPQPAYPPNDIIGAWISETFSLGAEPAPLGQTRPSAPLLPPVGIGEEGQPIDLMTSGSIAATPIVVASVAPAPTDAPSAVPETGWVVQIGAAPNQEAASSLLMEAASAVDDLGNFRPFVERFEKNGQVFYRARFAGFAHRDQAAVICSELKKAKMSCLAMQS